MTTFDDCEEAPVVLVPALRPYQEQFVSAVEEAWLNFTRILGVLPTGGGKTVVFSEIARREVAKGGRVLILAHTDELLDQAIDKLRKFTGLHAEKEKADESASPYASIVVASIQTIARTNRLTGFADDHFSLVICDESHRILAASYQKVMWYFHFGAASLVEDWSPPEDGTYIPKARCLGVTATADRGDKRSLGEFFQTCVFDYSLLSAVREGWLVRPIVKNIPLQLDVRGLRKKGGDYDANDVAERITPFLDGIAKAMVPEVRDRKTVVFTPSVETARIMAERLCAHGLDAEFVSGQCNNRNAKVAAFDKKPNGSAIVCAILLTEGWDCDTVSAVCVLRLTTIRSLLVQCIGRGLRPLTGLLDGLETKEERLAAIAHSAKRDCLAIDFLWLSDKLDLIHPVDLVATKPELKKAILESGIDDLVEAEEKAERDLIEALERATKKNARRQARTIDPLAFAVSLGDAALANYEPETARDALEPTQAQLDFLRRQGIDSANVKSRGLASKIIVRMLTRHRMGLATPRQLSLMSQLGLDEQTCATLSREEATATIDKLLAEKR